MRLAFFQLTVLFAGCLIGCARSSVDEHKNTKIGTGSTHVRRSSKLDFLSDAKDCVELLKAALPLCASVDPADVEVIVNSLKDPKFLARLETKNSIYISPRPIKSIIDTLAKRNDSQGQLAILELMKADAFTRGTFRAGWLIGASSNIHHPSDEFLDLLEATAEAERVESLDVAFTLAKMHTESSYRRIDNWIVKITDPALQMVACSVFAEHRNDRMTIKKCQELLLREKSTFVVKMSLIQSLFNGDPATWMHRFDPSLLKLPSRHEASTEALEDLLVVADECLAMKLDNERMSMLRKSRLEIQALLDFRKAKGEDTVVKLIEELADDRYSVRDTAMRSLVKYGDLAVPILSKSLQTPLTLEAKRRVEETLVRIREASRPKELVPPGRNPAVDGMELMLKQFKK